MCEVSMLKDAERQMCLILKGGDRIYSEWYSAQTKPGTEKQVLMETIEGNNLNKEDVEEWYISRKREDPNTVYISDHAMKRLKERNGWTKKASMRMMKKIHDNGLTPNQVKGKYAAWIRQKAENKAKHEHFLLYGENLYVFSRNTLVTVIPTPRKGSYYNQAYRECAV